MSEQLPPNSSSLYAAWKAFKSEDVRFLGYGEPHVPTGEERIFHAFEQGYRTGRRDQAVDFDLPEGGYIAAIEFAESEEERE
jgi:hypothetical protein